MPLPYDVDDVTPNRSYELPHSSAPSARTDIEHVGQALLSIDLDIHGILGDITSIEGTLATHAGQISTNASAVATAQTTANTAQTTANNALPKAGGVMTGVVTLYDYSEVTRLINKAAPSKGGEQTFEKPASGTTLTHNIIVDVLGDLFRIFENTSPYRGVTINLTGSGNLAALATQAYVTTQISNLVNGAGSALDTLNELAAALGNDANFSTTVSTALSARPTKTGAETISGNWTISGAWTISGIMTFSAEPKVVSLALSDGTQLITTAGAFITPTISMNMAMDSGTSKGSFTAKSTGNGDTNMAGMSFWNNSYAVKLGIRSDGLFSLGGWSASTHRWYVDCTTGNMTAAGNVTAYSDPRLKENVKLIDGPLQLLEMLDGVTFNWRSGIAAIENKAGHLDYGLLADQVQRVMPEIVSASPDMGGESYLTVAYDKLVPVLVEAVKSLNNRLIELEHRHLGLDPGCGA